MIVDNGLFLYALAHILTCQISFCGGKKYCIIYLKGGWLLQSAHCTVHVSIE